MSSYILTKYQRGHLNGISSPEVMIPLLRIMKIIVPSLKSYLLSKMFHYCEQGSSVPLHRWFLHVLSVISTQNNSAFLGKYSSFYRHCLYSLSWGTQSYHAMSLLYCLESLLWLQPPVKHFHAHSYIVVHLPSLYHKYNQCQ